MSIEKLLDTPKEIFKLDKEILSFKVDENKIKSIKEKEAICEEEIIITNLTSDYLAFKTMTTKRTIYSVDPSYCIIPPKADQKLKIQLYNIPGEKLEPKGHKFRFEGFTILESEKDSDAKVLFNEYIKKGNTLVGNILKRNVQFAHEIEAMQKYVPNKNIQMYLFIGFLLFSVVIGYFMFK